jgi:hypothetical protein
MLEASLERASCSTEGGSGSSVSNPNADDDEF